jgi:hypothetical protein
VKNKGAVLHGDRVDDMDANRVRVVVVGVLGVLLLLGLARGRAR